MSNGEPKVSEKHFVTFYSPGTLFPETSTLAVDSWDTKKAVDLSESIRERYNARPYGFRFETRLVGDPIPDGRGGLLNVESRELKTSGLHFLGGTLRRYDEVVERNAPEERILRSNMRGNGLWIVCTTTNGYRSTMAFEADSVIVDAAGAIVERGDDPRHVAYREDCDGRRAREEMPDV